MSPGPTAADAAAWGPEWDRVVDVVVVGAGAAGATAAAVAAARGLQVEVLEKAAHVGGTTAKSSARMWIPDNPHLRAAGIDDAREAALRYMARTAHPVAYDPDADDLGVGAAAHALLAAFYDHGGAAISHIADIGAVATRPVTYADYYALLQEDEVPSGRTIEPAPPAPLDDGDTGGAYFVRTLLDHAVGNGARISTGHAVADLVRTDGAVVGVMAHAGRQPVLIGARRGVVFASGGFLHDEDLVRQFLPGPVLGGSAAREATGDFVRIGTRAGAQLGNMANAWWDQVVVEHAVRDRATSRDAYVPFGDSMLMVNRYGRRVVNEKAPYNERGPVHLAWDPHRVEYPNLLLFMVFDDAVLHNPTRSLHRWPVPPPDGPSDHLVTGKDLEDLARALADRLRVLSPHTGRATLDPAFVDGLRATVERFNRHAAEGHDPDFHRGEAPVEHIWNPSPRPGAASACLHPLSSEGPYHAIILGPGALDTKGGPVVDASARVLDTHGHPIPGLYGAGNCIASPAARAYWGPGGTVGPAVAFGYIAATHLADAPGRIPSGPLQV